MIVIFFAALIAARWLAQFSLDELNHRHILAHAGAVPEPFKATVDEATYAKSIQYSFAQGRVGRFRDAYNVFVLYLVLFSGALPWALSAFQNALGNSAWAMAAFLFAVGVTMSLPDLPVDWFDQFRVERKFGFNTTTQRTWWLDRLKGLVLAAVLGYPLLVLVLKFVELTGDRWWLWAWCAFMAFQFLMMVLAPVLILPLFNKFTPLAEGSLRDRLVQLAGRTQFRARSIQVRDGSKRSRHSNAFFAGLGRWRKIVLFDTLVSQLGETELEAVLAHEIGHYKRKHIPKLLVWFALAS